MADAGEIWYQALSGAGRNLASGIDDAMVEYRKRQDKLQQADATMHRLNNTINPATGQKYIDDKDYQEYIHYSDKNRAFQAGAFLGAQKMIDTGRDAFYKTRREIAAANEATARASALYQGGVGSSSTAGKVPVDIGGRTVYVTGNEAARLNQQQVEEQIKTKYGLTPDQITDSSQHAGVEPIVDPNNKKIITGYKKSDTGAYTMIGGTDVKKDNDTYRTGGVVLPSSDLATIQRRLDLSKKTPEPAPQPSGVLPPPPQGKVYVRSPQGVIGSVPAEKL